MGLLLRMNKYKPHNFRQFSTEQSIVATNLFDWFYGKHPYSFFRVTSVYRAAPFHNPVLLEPTGTRQDYVVVKTALRAQVAGIVMDLPTWSQRMCVMRDFIARRKLIPR